MKKSLYDIPKYREFVAKKNRVLEFILDYYLSKIDDQIKSIEDTVKQAAVYYTWHSRDEYHVVIKKFYQSIDRPFDTAAAMCANYYTQMKRAVYGLSFEGENAAISTVMGKIPGLIKKSRLDSLDTMVGGDARARVYHSFTILKNKVQKALGDAMLMSDTSDEAVERVLYAMPKKIEKAQVRRVIRRPKPLKESAIKKPGNFGFITDDAWDALVDDYLDKIPSRGPEDTVEVPTDTGPVERYTWQLEQEITNDFVKDVRDGQHDAAKENGITEFQWVSIIDAKTDECCTWRDGLTTSEIERGLATNHQDDECDTIVPPAHMNCRCDLAPVTDADTLTDTEDLGDFETWLTAKQ